MLLKTIFPFSPGNVANAEGDWFESIVVGGGNIVKMLDVTIAITPITTSRKRYGMVVFFFLFAIGDVDNDDDLITLP
jgi:hypothetical protein